MDAFGLINMNGRLYDPVVGMFLSPDPLVCDASNPFCYNRYAYCLNNPLMYVDPSGENPLVIGLALLGAYIGGSLANQDLNPFKWDYSSGNTWAGMILGGVMGAGAGSILVTGGKLFVGLSSELGKFGVEFTIKGLAGAGYGSGGLMTASLVYQGVQGVEWRWDGRKRNNDDCSKLTASRDTWTYRYPYQTEYRDALVFEMSNGYRLVQYGVADALISFELTMYYYDSNGNREFIRDDYKFIMNNSYYLDGGINRFDFGVYELKDHGPTGHTPGTVFEVWNKGKQFESYFFYIEKGNDWLMMHPAAFPSDMAGCATIGTGIDEKGYDYRGQTKAPKILGSTNAFIDIKRQYDLRGAQHVIFIFSRFFNRYYIP